MIDVTSCVWLAAGVAAGLLHATMLWRATSRHSAWAPVLGMLRVGAVAIVLVLAALNGVILAAAAGWAVGFFSPSVWIVVRRVIPATPLPTIDSDK